jgi:hypothetical protein
MSDVNAAQPDRPRGGAPPPLDEESARAFRALRLLGERITPWLVDVGSWIFGGLTAVNLVVIAALIAVGPVDAGVRTATAALAAALPLNVAGIILLRLIKDVNDVGLDDLTQRAFQDAGFPEIDAYFPSPLESASHHARRARVALLYSVGIAAASSALTVIGITAAMWHMGRWIALVLLLAIILSAVVVAIAIAHALPPESDAEKALKRHHRQSAAPTATPTTPPARSEPPATFVP